MKLHRVRGGTIEALEQRQYNIGVGISLGNKWFSPENIVEATKWALSHTREHVVIYVADTIHAINLSVRNKVSLERARRIAVRYGHELMTKVQEEVPKHLSQEEISKIIYATWDDIDNTAYRAKVNYLYGLYESNTEFKRCIQDVVHGWVAKEARAFREDEIEKFGTYILEELPEVSGRVPIKGIVYEAYAYPCDGELTQLVEKLQKGEMFPEIKQNIMDTEPKVFLELR